MSDNKLLVEITNAGRSFTTHPEAREFGLTNYHHWKNLSSVRNGKIYEVVKTITINGFTGSFVLKDDTGIEYIIERSGCKIITERPFNSWFHISYDFLISNAWFRQYTIDELADIIYCELDNNLYQQLSGVTKKEKARLLYNRICENAKIPNTSEKKPIGFKLVKNKYRQAVYEILKADNHSHDYWFNNYFDQNIHSYGYNFGFSSEKTDPSGISIHRILEKAGVLDKWFKPVYEFERVIKLDYGADVKIKFDNEVKKVEYDSKLYDKSFLLKIRERFTEKINGYDVNIPKIKVGCINLTLEDIDILLKELDT